MIDTTVRLVGNGHTITLTNTAEELHRQPGGGGWGLAPVVNSWFEGAGDGVRLRGTRRTARELTIPVAAFGESRAEVELELRRLAQTIRDPFIVYVDQPNESYWIEAVYDSGAEGSYSLAPELYSEAPIVLKCPDPFWTSDTSQAITIAPTPADAPFLPELAGLHVGSAAAFGDVAVMNVGDVDSRVTWTIHGPGVNPVIKVNGEGFTLTKTLTASDVVTVAYADGSWTIVDQNGTNLYGQLNAAPYFPSLPPGASIVTATMGSTGPGSFIQGIYPERREVVY